MRQKLSVLLFVFLILSMFVYAEEKTEIPVDELVIKPKIKTSLGMEFELRDDDNTAERHIIVRPNSPEITSEASGFLKISRSINPSFYIGPYIDAEGILGLKLHNNDNEIQIRSFLGQALAGIKGGYEVQSKLLKGSSIEFAIPVAIHLRINEEDWLHDAPAGITEMQYFSFVHIGSGASMKLDLKLKKYFTAIQFKENFIFGFEPTNKFHDSDKNLFYSNVMKLSIENAPFNFIHPAVNLVFGVEDRLTLERDYFGNYIQNRLIAGIYYTPIKGFTFYTEPLRYYYSIRRAHMTLEEYDQRAKLEARIGMTVKHKNLKVECAVTPVYWALKREKLNTDDIKTVALSTAVTLDF